MGLSQKVPGSQHQTLQIFKVPMDNRIILTLPSLMDADFFSGFFADFQVAPEFDNVAVTVDVRSKWQHLEPSSCPGCDVFRPKRWRTE